MGFLVPAFLAGFAALAVPVLMHLRDRNEETPTRFPSLMFLVRLPIRTSDRSTITDWPLLLLRALAVAILVLAFTRPFFGASRAETAEARSRNVVLMLDRSMSMGYAGTWGAALDSARAVLGSLDATDHVALVLFDKEAEQAVDWTRDHAAVRAALDATTPMARATRYGAALRAARGALVSAPLGAPEFVLVTDMQRTGIAGVAGLDLPKGLPVRVVSVAAPMRPNTFIRSVDARRITGGMGSQDRVQLQVVARVLARELPDTRHASLTLHLAGREVGTRTVTLQPNGELAVLFDPVPAPATAVDGTVSITADALPGDDRFHFSLPADDGLLLMVAMPSDLSRDDLLYLERALAIGRAPAVRVERRNTGNLDATALARAHAVLFWDVLPPTDDAFTRWVEQGGGAIVLAGPRLAARGNTALGHAALATATVTGLADRRPAGGAMLGDARYEHPLFAPFRAAQAAMAAPRFYRYARLEPAVGADLLARFDDGSPAVLERPVQDGRVLVLATALDAREGDFPLQPAFLPLVRRLVLHAAGYENQPLARTTGESWAPRRVHRDVVVRAPDGTLLRPDSGRAAVALQQVGVYTAYQGRADGAARERVAVNVPPGESELATASVSDLLLGVTESADSTFHGVVAPTAREMESNQRFWRWLVLIACLMLVGEAIVASQGWRGRARRASVPVGSP